MPSSIPEGVGYIQSWTDLRSYRIEIIENKIGAGLIEEVVAVAEGELELVAEMLRNQVYVHALSVSLRTFY